MSINTDSIQALTDSITKSLEQIVSLNETCKRNEETISDLNTKNSELTQELSKSKDEIVKLDEDVVGLNKELHSHDELVKKLEGENKALSASLKKLGKAKGKKKTKASAN